MQLRNALVSGQRQDPVIPQTGKMMPITEQPTATLRPRSRFDLAEATSGAFETSLGVMAIGLGLLLAFFADLPLPF